MYLYSFTKQILMYLFKIRLAILLLASFSILGQPPSKIEQDQIQILYRVINPNKTKRKVKERLQLLNDETTCHSALLLNNANKLPRQFSKLKLLTHGYNQQFNRSMIESYALRMMDSMIRVYKSDTIYFRGSKDQAYYSKQWDATKSAIDIARKGGSFFKHNWIPLQLLEKRTDGDLTIKAKGKLFNKLTYKTISLPVGYAPVFPAIDSALCTPINRYHMLRKMRGYGIDKFKYIKYRAPHRATVREVFEIYFEKNGVDATPESLERIIGYLKKNKFSILQARIEGYSSVEGTDSRNDALQQRRAQVLLRTLQRYNNEPILSDTVLVQSGIHMFRESIQQSYYKWLDTLTDEQLKATVRDNPILVQSLEPILAQHRKAVLKLTVAKQLDEKGILDNFFNDYAYWTNQLIPIWRKAPKAEVEARVMGLMEYLFALLEQNKLTSMQVAELLDNHRASEMLRILAVYHHIIQFEKQTILENLAWEKYAEKHNFTELFLLAQSNLVSLIINPNKYHEKNVLMYEIFRRQLVDIQTYTFEYIQRGLLSASNICNMDFTNSARLRPFKLNHLSFIQLLAQTHDIPCEQFKLDPFAIQPNSNEWLDSQYKLSGQQVNVPCLGYSGILPFQHVELIPPSFGEEVLSPLLYYLKVLFVYADTKIKDHMITSDTMYEFDLFTLASFHVNEWDPLGNYFIDPEVQLPELYKVIGLLKKSENRICRYQVNQLYLNFHLKALHYLSRYFEPGNEQHTKIAQQSLKFISNYYTKRAAYISPALADYLVRQLNAFHWIPGKYDGTWHAWQILKSIEKYRYYTQEEQALVTRYGFMHSGKEKSKIWSK